MNKQASTPFGVLFASEPVIIEKTDPQYSGETQISANTADLATDTYMKWTEDSDK